MFKDLPRKISQLQALGYWTDWHLFNAADFGVCQLRPRVIFVALQRDIAPHFRWPAPSMTLPPTGELLGDLMAERHWEGVTDWQQGANNIAPTLVGGSKNTGALIWAQHVLDRHGPRWECREQSADHVPDLWTSSACHD